MAKLFRRRKDSSSFCRGTRARVSSAKGEHAHIAPTSQVVAVAAAGRASGPGSAASMGQRNTICILLLGLACGFLLGQRFPSPASSAGDQLGSSTAAETDAALASCQSALATLLQAGQDHEKEVQAREHQQRHVESAEADLKAQLASKTTLERACRTTLTKMYTAASGILNKAHPERPPSLKVLNADPRPAQASPQSAAPSAITGREN
jgi:hypothetical protein